MVVKGKRSEDGTVVESVTNTCLCGVVIYTHSHTCYPGSLHSKSSHCRAWPIGHCPSVCFFLATHLFFFLLIKIVFSANFSYWIHILKGIFMQVWNKSKKKNVAYNTWTLLNIYFWAVHNTWITCSFKRKKCKAFTRHLPHWIPI